MPPAVDQSYRVYFLNAQNRITDTQAIDCADDQACVQRALELLRGHPDYWAVEIWQDTRKIGTYKPPVVGAGRTIITPSV